MRFRYDAQRRRLALDEAVLIPTNDSVKSAEYEAFNSGDDCVVLASLRRR
jgi:hypothetical protein